MREIRLILWLMLVGGLTAAHADRDIVYAARYYTPPGSHRTSHFHLYRINPDGTGKTQLTFGNGDEEEPHWSADGRRITFTAYAASSDTAMLCEIGASGSKRRVLKTLTDNDYPHLPPVANYRLENTGDDAEEIDHHILVNLKTGHRMTLTVPDHGNLSDLLLAVPGGGLIYAVNNHNSTVGTDYLFYQLNPSTGTLRYLTEGQFLAWSPDGSHFCTAPGRDTTPYEKRKEPYAIPKGALADEITDAEYRMVWFAPLYVRATAGGPMRQLTPWLSIVTGADWRNVKPSPPRKIQGNVSAGEVTVR